MANFNLLVPQILKHEGLFADHPADPGGATNMGVTLGTLRSTGLDIDLDGDTDIDDLMALTKEDVTNRIFKPFFWDRCQADSIRNQSVANIIVDWLWTSGTPAIKHVQRLLGVEPDGAVGPVTLAALNGYPDQRELHGLIWSRRKQYFEDIVKNRPPMKVFLKGWMNRLNSYVYED